MNFQYNFDDIDDYVQGRMSDADRAAFEAALTADPQLAVQVDALRAEATVLRSLRREGLLEKMTEWEGEMPAKPKVVPLWQRPWMQAVAAAVTAILLVWALWPNFQTKPADTGIADRPGLQDSSSDITASNSRSKDTFKEGSEKSVSPPQKQPPIESPYAELAVRNFNTDYSSIHLMGESGTQKEQNPLQLAAEAIEQKKYEKALAYLKKVPDGNPDDYSAAQIMAGDVYFLQKKFALAEKAYLQPAQSKKDKFRDVAQWHLLLAYLAIYPQKTGDFERTINAILNDEAHPYNESAKSIRNQLEKK